MSSWLEHGAECAGTSNGSPERLFVSRVCSERCGGEGNQAGNKFAKTFNGKVGAILTPANQDAEEHFGYNSISRNSK
jgi:hypothetical protein